MMENPNSPFFSPLRWPAAVSLWGLYILTFILSTQRVTRLAIGSFLVPPAYFAVVLILLGMISFPKLMNFKRVKYLIFFTLAYMTVMILSSLVNTLFDVYGISIKSTIKWFIFFLTIILVVGTLKKKKEVHFLLKMTVIVIGVICLYGIYHYKFVYPHFVNPFWQVANQNALLNWTAGVFIINLYFLVKAPTRASKLFWFGVLLINLYAQIFTLSRFGWGTIFLTFLLFGFALKQFKILAGTLVFVVLLALLLPNNAENIRLFNRFSSLTSTKSAKATSHNRIKYAIKTKDIFYDHPLLGVGIDNFQIYQPENFSHQVDNVSHNLYLNIISETGLIGSMILFLLFLRVVYLASQVYLSPLPKQDKELLSYLLISVAMYLWRGATSHEFLFMPITGFIFGVTIAYIHILLAEIPTTPVNSKPIPA